ncbi:M48 family metallopeptidase [Candidatus Woesearchaeota archaeon]|nr:M48 family metallopeptidase [Candidatus Woesearchaeota archaeon]
MERLNFHDEIKKNKIYSGLLILIVFAVLFALAYVIMRIFSPGSFFFIMIVAIVISLLYIVIGYYNSAKIAVASVNAKEASTSEYRQYHDLVEGLCLASGLPKPKLYIMQNEQINAFASGRDPKNAVICVTTGCLNKLNKQELEGVLSHELSHIANYDIRFMTLTAVLVGMIAIISEIFLRSLWFRGNDRDNKGGAILIVIGIVLAILAPLITQLVQFAISRKRELVADSNAVKFTRSPTGLINALTKIKDNKDMKVSGAVAPLFLAKPSNVANLFETHPPLTERIERLKKM